MKKYLLFLSSMFLLTLVHIIINYNGDLCMKFLFSLIVVVSFMLVACSAYDSSTGSKGPFVVPDKRAN